MQLDQLLRLPKYEKSVRDVISRNIDYLYDPGPKVLLSTVSPTTLPPARLQIVLWSLKVEV
jgi:hypothetical protein